MEAYRITVDEYERLFDVRIFDEPERIELVDGFLLRKKRKSPEHCYATNRLRRTIADLLGAGWFANTGGPIRIPDHDEPEPDVSVVRGSIEDYRHRHPGPADVGLVVEVSLTTLDLDRGLKLSAYARAGIPVYWIINLAERQAEVYTGPRPGAYQTRTDYKPGQAVPVVIDGRQLGDIAVDAILP
jgi:Uma2 family endonuclease